MKKVFVRITDKVSVEDAVKHLTGLGYREVWFAGFRPHNATVIVGYHRGEIGWDTDTDYIDGEGYEEVFLPETPVKNVFIRVGGHFACYAKAERYMQSLGYQWDGCENLAGKLEEWGSVVLLGRSDGCLTHSGHLDEKDMLSCNFREVFLPPAKHAHYDLIVKWAADVSQKVWWKSSLGWIKVDQPNWGENAEYHVGDNPPKRTIVIGDVEIDAPETVEPNTGVDYFVVDCGSAKMFGEMNDWVGDEFDIQALKRGMVHLNKEAALAHAKALIKISGGIV